MTHSHQAVTVDNLRLRVAGGVMNAVMNVSWNGSWRFKKGDPPANHDAVWLFGKLRRTVVVEDLSCDQLLQILAPAASRSQKGVDADRRRLYGELRRRVSESHSTQQEFGMPRIRHYCGSSPQMQEIVTDAVRILPDFAKKTYTVKHYGPWEHCMVSPSGSSHTAPSGCEIVPGEDGMGVFVQRSATNHGSGNVEFRNVSIRMQLPPSGTPIQLRFVGITMVHVSEESFQLGDPAGLDGPDNTFFNASEKAANPPTNFTYPVDSEDAITVVNDYPSTPTPPTLIWNTANQNGKRGSIPAAYPKGYASFYCMRQMVSQGAYADFINALEGDAVTNRFPYGGQGDYRYRVYKTTNSERVAIRPHRPANWVSWADASAWLWWVGLRPMTELEYEKACRGPAPAVSGEYAWGTTEITTTYVIIGDENDHLQHVTGNANIANALHEFRGGDGGIGPVQDTAFGRGATPETFEPDTDGEYQPLRLAGRQKHGTTWYGIFGMTGNLWELVVSAGNDAGRSFTGVHGNGKLTDTGEPAYTADAAWPGDDCMGVGYRGGSWYSGTNEGAVAYRGQSTGIAGYTFRSHDTGIRGVRTTPKPPTQS